MNSLLSAGLILLLGFVGARVLKLVRLPNVTAFLIVGIIIGPQILNLVTAEIFTASEFFSNLVLGLIAFSLGESFPNPVKWKTTIPFSIHRTGHVYLEVINPHGRAVDVLVDRRMEAGNHMVTWQSTNHPEGLYLYRLCFERNSQAGKILVCPE